MGARTFFATCLPLAAFAACTSPGRAADALAAGDTPPNPMPALVLEFAADERGTEQYWSLPSEARRLQEEAVSAGWRARLDALDVSALPRDGQVDWLLLDNHLRAQARRHAADAAKRAEVAELLPFAADIMALEEARWTLQGPEPEQAAGRLDVLAKQAKALRERVQKTEQEPGPEPSAAEPATAAGAEPSP
ncbi:MAG: hypothetical protein FJ296_02985, partial [Planctomycetes bacterium]|nr:hypothetical protein [Planctomycetota bacterium]